MKNSLKIDCSKSTYLDKFLADKNFSSENILLSGNFYENHNVFNNLKTILEFDFSNIDLTNIHKIYLTLFIDKLKCSPNNSIDLVILPNTSIIDINNVTWNNYPRTNTNNNLMLCNISGDINDYFKIDITNLFKRATIHNNILSLTIDTINKDYTSLIEFASANSDKKPYLNCIFKKSYMKEEINNNPLNTITSEDFKMYYENINILLKSFENNINDKINTLKNAIDDIKNKSNILDNIGSNISTLNEILPTCNNNVTTLSQNLSNIKNSIENLNLQINDNLLIENLDTLSKSILNSTTTINELLKYLKDLSISSYE